MANKDLFLFHEQAVPYEHLMKTDANNKGEFLEIAVAPSFIAQLFVEEKEYLAELLEGKSPTLSFDLNLAALQVLKQLSNNPYQGSLALHYLHNKIEEFHLLQYQNWRYSQKPISHALHPKDKAILHQIKHYITMNYNQSFTLTELAHQAGINQTKLKQGFKALFGQTTFQYLHDLRMQQALELLQNQTHTIGEIAEMVGYKHSHHFTTAFKKYYGCFY
ncbi:MULTISPECIES: helix-turn-helix transcriptional regulator [unclassified Myroides]|uniref:helix-turn-helix transcriptional regulator n=1 Tax=unclassified Myroides TaxID=2642485 RepID=UPI003D2F9545